MLDQQCSLETGQYHQLRPSSLIYDLHQSSGQGERHDFSWQLFNNQYLTKTVAANAQVCYVNRRPIYGQIHYVKQHIVVEDPLNFRRSIQTMIHQMMHILVMDQQFYQYFKINSSSNKNRPINQTQKCEGENCSIITPKVMQYVRNYFNCGDSQIGAMLAGKKDLSHWNLRVFHDEIMTPVLGLSSGRMTGLSLALLEDSGFYSSVNYSYQQKANFGKGRGCSFAKGIRSKQDQCQQNICDNQHRYGQRCIKRNQKNMNEIFEFNAPGFICDDPLLSTQDHFTLTYYGRSSRCFNIERDQNRIPACYKAECRNGIIYIQIGEKSHACNKPGQWLSVGYSWKVQCPKDLQLFCAVPICHDLCEGRGVCVNGKCLYP